MEEIILLSHGSGGKQTNSLIKELFGRYFNNDILNKMNDAAHLTLKRNKIAFTTDSFVVKPLFFNGGDIGKLAVCGTVNDLAVSGAKPGYLTAAFIIEEGFLIKDLEKIVKSMAEEAIKSEVLIAAGDTKVVEKGSCDGIFINTTGIGEFYEGVNIDASNAVPGDVVIVNGPVGNHGVTILCERGGVDISGNLKSDCAPLNFLIADVLKVCPEVHVMRDATRGGIAAVLNEIAGESSVDIEIKEASIPVLEEVKGVCELLGIDPLYSANEGIVCIFVPEEFGEDILQIMRRNPLGKDSTVIGRITEGNGKVYTRTITGGRRIVDMPQGEQLPRIC